MKMLCLFFLMLVCFFSSLYAQTPQVKLLPRKPSIKKADSVYRFLTLLPENFATCQYGFFCKQELKLEKEIKVPIKFRLGSLEYTNWLEGKSRFKPAN